MEHMLTAAHLAISMPRAYRSRPLLTIAALLVAMAVLLSLSAGSRAAGCTITWVGDVDANWYGGTSGMNTNWDDDSLS